MEMLRCRRSPRSTRTRFDRSSSTAARRDVTNIHTPTTRETVPRITVLQTAEATIATPRTTNPAPAKVTGRFDAGVRTRTESPSTSITTDCFTTVVSASLRLSMSLRPACTAPSRRVRAAFPSKLGARRRQGKSLRSPSVASTRDEVGAETAEGECGHRRGSRCRRCRRTVRDSDREGRGTDQRTGASRPPPVRGSGHHSSLPTWRRGL